MRGYGFTSSTEQVMNNVKLSDQEYFFIEVIRKFDFLRQLGYSTISLSVYGRETGILLENRRSKKKITISWLDDNEFYLNVETMQNILARGKKKSYDIKELYAFKGKSISEEMLQLSSLTIAEVVRNNAKFLEDNFHEILSENLWFSKD